MPKLAAGNVLPLLYSRFDLGTRGLAELWFIDDRLVDYGLAGLACVRRCDLFSIADDRSWAELLAPGTGWIHFTYFSVNDGVGVVTIARGPKYEDLVATVPLINSAIAINEPAIIEEDHPQLD